VTAASFRALSGLDTKGEVEERVRSWLKESADEFDIIFAYDEEALRGRTEAPV